MAHPQEIEFCESVKRLFPSFFVGRLVLDVGSLDVNGNNQHLFDDCLYLGVDLLPGKNVDLVAKGHDLGLPEESVDVIVSTECFEHDQFYELTLQNAVRMLKPGGLFFFSCATTGRPEHGTSKTTPEEAPFLQNFEGWSDYYKNLEESDIRAAVDVDVVFDRYSFSVNTESCDLYFWGLKTGTLVDRLDYSIQVHQSVLQTTLRETAGRLAEATKGIAGRDGEISRLNRVVAERDESLSRRGEVILTLEGMLADRDLQIESLTSSTSWRVTRPLRFLRKIF